MWRAAQSAGKRCARLGRLVTRCILLCVSRSQWGAERWSEHWTLTTIRSLCVVPQTQLASHSPTSLLLMSASAADSAAAAAPAAPAASASASLTRAELAHMIDHTLLKPEATRADIARLCEEASTYGFWSVCVNSCWVGVCKELLASSGVKVCVVVGFPLGCMDSRSKAFEAAEAVRSGADEVDMVLCVGALKGGEDSRVEEDIRGVVAAAAGKPVKVILETGSLNDEQKVRACHIAERAGAAFVKTSTGFVAASAATAHDIALMRKSVSKAVSVKASGGVRSLEDARTMIDNGASRLGTSSGVAIVTGVPAAAGAY